MRKLSILIFLFLLAHGEIWAQSGIIAGKLTDENDQPVSGATIRISKAGKAVDTYSDEDGLFYTQLLHSDLYHLDVIIRGRVLKAGKVYVPNVQKKKKFYFLKIAGNKIRVRIDGEDPFLKAKVSKIKNTNPHDLFDFEGDLSNNLIDHVNMGSYRLIWSRQPDSTK